MSDYEAENGDVDMAALAVEGTSAGRALALPLEDRILGCRAAEPIRIDADLLRATAAAVSRHTLRALVSDLSTRSTGGAGARARPRSRRARR